MTARDEYKWLADEAESGRTAAGREARFALNEIDSLRARLEAQRPTSPPLDGRCHSRFALPGARISGERPVYPCHDVEGHPGIHWAEGPVGVGQISWASGVEGEWRQ